MGPVASMGEHRIGKGYHKLQQTTEPTVTAASAVRELLHRSPADELVTQSCEHPLSRVLKPGERGRSPRNQRLIHSTLNNVGIFIELSGFHIRTNTFPASRLHGAAVHRHLPHHVGQHGDVRLHGRFRGDVVADALHKRSLAARHSHTLHFCVPVRQVVKAPKKAVPRARGLAAPTTASRPTTGPAPPQANRAKIGHGLGLRHGVRGHRHIHGA
mmetsp:Transcript_89070/g.256829  ORF Transcript_89070/g.256829 Transcript_89070/m.256829 type:complete len:214 (+) Transcript_89070:276-917(+)